MRRYGTFLLIGLILGLFIEAQLKLVAGINPPAFIFAVITYPVILSLAYAISRFIDRWVETCWKGDLLHYMTCGLGGLAIEWILLGNGPESNAFQPGMFAMWTTFCFGPRVLTRSSPSIQRGRRKFWVAFAFVALLLTLSILLAPDPRANLLIAVFGLSGSYALWSVWLLVLAWRSRHRSEAEAATGA